MIAAFIAGIWKGLKSNPKIVFGIIGAAALIFLGLHIKSEIKAYGQARYDAGVSDTEKAVAKKVKETKKKVDDVVDAGEKDAAETQTVFVEVTKEVAVIDATVLAENKSLKLQIQTLEERISDAPVDDSFCAVQPISDDSLQIHADIDRLLSGG